MDTIYKIIIHKNNEYTIYNDSDEIININININICQSKLFSNDKFQLKDNKVIIIDSPIRQNKKLCGVLELKNTYGRTTNKKKLLYKCIPYNKELPDFLIPYEITLSFNKSLINKFILFSFILFLFI